MSTTIRRSTRLEIRTAVKRSRSPELSIRSDLIQSNQSPLRSKKRRMVETYASQSPFPTFLRPTPEEALSVFKLLSNAHPDKSAFRVSPDIAGNSATTCGNVPNVIESLIGTILSQNTSGRNSTRAKESLDTAFGRNNFAAIASSPKEAVVDAIRHGGLANKKATTIQNLLSTIKERHGSYSLQHLAEQKSDGVKLTDEEIMKELVSYDGVGPKTASCVLLFCLGRDSFAVDTHVFRLSKLLGWVPSSCDRVLAQAHLDRKIPDELKYGLHVLMIQHGRSCKGCKGGGAKSSCILKEYLKGRETVSDPLLKVASAVLEDVV